MNKIIPLSLIAIASLVANDIQLAPISVESTIITEVSQNAQVSADLAEALSESVPSIDMNRRSGIANDVFIRGQKRDNISVEVDGTKVFGACPNRMDPPISHIITSQIDSIEIIEGPYDVENFGTLSGGIKIKTKKPKKDFNGQVDFGIGSWNYKKVGATFSGGNDIIRVLVSGSSESSGQYKDGNGDTLSQQTAKKAPLANRYAKQYEDINGYKKNSIMAKAFVTVTDDQELRLSYTKNNSQDILYPSTPMDADYDISNIYSVEYDIKDINDVYKDVNLQYYYSDVDHPMNTRYRNSGANVYITNHLKTTMQGLKLKNNFDIDSFKLLVGLDASQRTWEGEKYKTTVATGAEVHDSISLTHTETQNSAIFAKLSKEFGDFTVEVGARYDSTDIKPENVTFKSNDYQAFSSNLLATYNLNKENKIFLGIGQASRVPDARELYLDGSGNPDLEQTTNTEVDLGYEIDNYAFKLKIKGFYSMLKDYIYFQKTLPSNKFQNIDATVYGGELSASYYVNDDITLDAGVSYKKGKKDKALVGQTDKDLADIAPLRGRLALNYEYMHNSIAKIEVAASDKWSNYDKDNGEQELSSWAVLNLKVKHSINKNFDFTLGINNLLDKAYAKSNTYTDLVLISAGVDTMLLNEPGRYVYTNLNFKF